ncbi:diacylglycerol kinase family protein [Ornithinibacillus salinisoli]|uniref:Diacylglycerol kinase family protein n=1 Tax=Ornithinibacillus salinisoli TaxID=1848459 RepID=A0ABW4W315_9BACI
MNVKKRNIGISYAWNGIKEVFRSELNFRLHIVAAIVVICSGVICHLTKIEWAFILICIAIVLITEIVNSAIEKMMDFLNPEHHPSVKVIKDIAASSVLIAAFFAAIIGTIIFAPKIIDFIQGLL